MLAKSSSKSGGRSSIEIRMGSAKSVTHFGYGVGEEMGVGVIDTRLVAMVFVAVGVAVAPWKAMAGN